MAVSTIAGDYGGYLKIPCILKEGNITYGARTYGTDGTYEKGVVFASELRKGDIVSLSPDVANVYTATGPCPVVQANVNAEDTVIGRIVSAPQPADGMGTISASQDTWADMLSGDYYRTATLEVWGGITSIMTAICVCGTTAVVPGIKTTLSVDASATAAAHALSLADDTTNGAGFVPLTYVAADGTYTVLVGINDIATVVT